MDLGRINIKSNDTCVLPTSGSSCKGPFARKLVLKQNVKITSIYGFFLFFFHLPATGECFCRHHLRLIAKHHCEIGILISILQMRKLSWWYLTCYFSWSRMVSKWQSQDSFPSLSHTKASHLAAVLPPTAVSESVSI